MRFIENGYWGTRWAAPISSLVAEKYLKGKVERKWLEKYIINGDLTEEYLKPYSLKILKLMSRNLILEKFDLLSIILVSILTISGLINIYSTTYVSGSEMLSLSNPFGKQLLFVFFSIILFWTILFLKGKLFQQYSSLLYLFMTITLILVLFLEMR